MDLTRTVCVGGIDDRGHALHRAVADAHGAAVRAVRPGALASEIDTAARETLARHGLAETFGHSTGHGIGIEVHERPRIAQRRAEAGTDSDASLRSGMAFTIEPGVYLPGYGGVRLEDDVVVTEDGCEVLTNAPRELVVR